MTAAVRVVLSSAYAVLDARLEALPAPASGLPAGAREAVFLRSLARGRAGLGTRSVGPLPAQDDVRHGLLQLEAEYLIWARNPAALAVRSRALIDLLLDLPDSTLPPIEASPGRVRGADLLRAGSPISETQPNAWRQSLALQLEIDYRVVAPSSEDVIGRVEVDLVGELDEDFSVGGGS